jgi:urease accessory protein
MRGEKPFIFADVKSGKGVDEVINWIKSDVLFEDVK